MGRTGRATDLCPGGPHRAHGKGGRPRPWGRGGRGARGPRGAYSLAVSEASKSSFLQEGQAADVDVFTLRKRDREGGRRRGRRTDKEEKENSLFLRLLCVSRLVHVVRFRNFRGVRLVQHPSRSRPSPPLTPDALRAPPEAPPWRLPLGNDGALIASGAGVVS